jgi:hypothetical protein
LTKTIAAEHIAEVFYDLSTVFGESAKNLIPAPEIQANIGMHSDCKKGGKTYARDYPALGMADVYASAGC